MTVRTLGEVLAELENVEEGARSAAGDLGRLTRRVVELTAALEEAREARDDVSAVYLDLRDRKEELEEEALYLRMVS